ncbi:MAG: endonuclease/exonuclease/phosphatase family protein [Sedimentisphaerales bacterium]|nr:endonuclease/exonuclease/phosphatase family protein [Sedimentisphaerales bacterium]
MVNSLLTTTQKAIRRPRDITFTGVKIPLRVMSYNIHYCVGVDRLHNIDRIAGIIKNSGAEIIGLNEVDSRFSSRSQYADQARLLAEKLNMYYAFCPTIKNGESGTGYGNAILSNYKLADVESYSLPHKEQTEPRGCMSAMFTCRGRWLIILVTHLDHEDEEIRQKQVNHIEAIAANSDVPVIITGDFNEDITGAEGENRIWEGFMKRYYSVFDLAGTGEPETYFGKQSKTIDYIFVDGELIDSVERSYVVTNEQTNMASDHRPLVADLSIIV